MLEDVFLSVLSKTVYLCILECSCILLFAVIYSQARAAQELQAGMISDPLFNVVHETTAPVVVVVFPSLARQ